SYCMRSSFSSSAFHTKVCSPFWYTLRPSAGAAVAVDDDDPPLDCEGLRPSEVLSSNPAISSSPVEKGRWNTVPGGCTVMLETTGRRLRGRYAAVTEVRIGPVEPVTALSTARHCR